MAPELRSEAYLKYHVQVFKRGMGRPIEAPPPYAPHRQEAVLRKDVLDALIAGTKSTTIAGPIPGSTSSTPRPATTRPFPKQSLDSPPDP